VAAVNRLTEAALPALFSVAVRPEHQAGTGPKHMADIFEYSEERRRGFVLAQASANAPVE